MDADLPTTLLAWYATHKRDLPWRHATEPYAVLVSEIMLQQTGVDRVIPKYRAFLAELPALADLAQAPTAHVIVLWSGLGHNRRAVWLQRAAQEALRRWGKLPDGVDDLESLPGIGPYTARAVACFAFGAQVAVCDTNVRRVLMRLVHGHMERPPSCAQMLGLAESLLPPGRASDWNQALMDLGATVCIRRAPRCPICPLHSMCRAFPAPAEQGRKSTLEESRPRWQAQPFIGSRRYYRGRIIEALRRLGAGVSLTLAELGALIKPHFTAADTPWLEEMVADLVRDGLVARDRDGGVALPP